MCKAVISSQELLKQQDLALLSNGITLDDKEKIVVTAPALCTGVKPTHPIPSGQ